MKIIVLIILFFGCFQIKVKNKDFTEFIKSFEENRHLIDLDFARNYLGFEPNPDESKIYTDKVIFNNDSLIGFTCFITCAAGGICERTNYYIFNFFGELISCTKNIEFNFADCSLNDYKKCIFYSDSLLIFKNSEERTNCDNDSLISKKTKIEYFKVMPNAVLEKLNTDYINTNREYYFASSEFLKSEQLETFTCEEFGIIRNEIFAAHGYKFKTKKWRIYFAEKEWYEPCYENVDQLLTIIEKQNIKTIIKLEKNRNAH